MIQEANLQWQYVDTDCKLIMPWYVKPALEWLKQQDVSNWNVFEYGAGYSTIWWRANAEDVQSVDNQLSWAKAMGADFILTESEYVNAISKYFISGFKSEFAPDRISKKPSFDCVIVDGVFRESCVKHCLEFIKQGGYLIIDNYDSENYDISQTEELLKDWPVTIYKQPNHSIWQTAIFQKP